MAKSLWEILVDDRNAAQKSDPATCQCCKGTGKVRKGSDECPRCEGSGTDKALVATNR